MSKKDLSLNEMMDKMYEEMDAEQRKKWDEMYESTIISDPDYGKVKVQLVNKSKNPKPEYGTKLASGFDLRANLDESITLGPLERAIIPTGLYYALPENLEMQVRPRSGLAAKHGITVLNSPGTIDADYRGEVGVILVNLSNEPFTVNHGERIAQGVFAHSGGGNLYKTIEVEELDETERGTGGFGSTGTK